MVDPLVRDVRLTKVLMDGGSGLNILYIKTLDHMKISRSEVKPTGAPFHGVVPGRPAKPLGQINLPVTFGTPDNFRTEVLTFEVADFPGTYHAILGRPCYAKFMAVPNYVYLKLKMPGPRGVITVQSNFRHAYVCDQENCSLAAEQTAAAELDSLKSAIAEATPPTKKALASTSFQSAHNSKSVQIDPEDPAKTTRIGTALGDK